MSSLKDVEKRYFERLFAMHTGWVLDYSDPTFGELFNRYKVDIHGPKYQKYGTSKAKKLRAFWDEESDKLVGDVMLEMLDSYEGICDLNKQRVDKNVLEKSRNIANRLTGKSTSEKTSRTVDDFLHSEFTIPNIQKMNILQRYVFKFLRQHSQALQEKGKEII